MARPLPRIAPPQPTPLDVLRWRLRRLPRIAPAVFAVAGLGLFAAGHYLGDLRPGYDPHPALAGTPEPLAPAAAPVTDRRALVAACSDAVVGAQRAWFYRVTGVPAPSSATPLTFRSILTAQGFDLADLEPMPTRNCASLADGPEQPVEGWLLADTNRVQMPIPAEP